MFFYSELDMRPFKVVSNKNIGLNYSCKYLSEINCHFSPRATFSELTEPNIEFSFTMIILIDKDFNCRLWHCTLSIVSIQ